ncbi:hypothetical protein CHARACLAT_027410 [Characodon lateralis]|uniref:Uncharacterized protein n=1 Tax=Characodon lateralis TaxID=208331 RepID=A0ABU7CRP8_9TELE|nr:hypothetical protein [Characodon lateralis]
MKRNKVSQSVIFYRFFHCGSRGSCCPSPSVYGREAGYTLDRSPLHRRAINSFSKVSVILYCTALHCIIFSHLLCPQYAPSQFVPECQLHCINMLQFSLQSLKTIFLC